MSRIGKLPIDVPAGVTITVDSDVLTVKGPKGELTVPHLSDVTVTVEGTVARVARNNDERIAKAQHGLQRALLFNAVEGVTKGYEKKLEVNGVGFRVNGGGQEIEMSLGFSHPVKYKAKDGVQLHCRARVTVRTNIAQLVGGATEETIIARVGEGIISAIGAADTHLIVLESPQLISKRVLEKGLDAQTAFEILSIDIADVDVGRNIGAELMTDQAEADKRIAQARAEERRAMAVAKEQEMKAAVQEMQAKVVEAESEVPKALAKALESGNIGVMDYYRMNNIIADTKMRELIGDPGSDQDLPKGDHTK